VRIAQKESSRRAFISFVDDSANTVDVMYPSWSSSKEQEEEGVPAKKVQKLLPFETDAAARASESDRLRDTFYPAANALKEEGNQLFKLKDYEAAHERYSTIAKGFHARPRKAGEAILVAGDADAGELRMDTVTSVDAEGNCELNSGEEVPMTTTLLVYDQLLPLQTAAYMNRARCRQNLGLHREAAQDLTTVLSLWGAAPRRMLEADPEMKEAEGKGLYTARYLRAKSRLARGMLRQAAFDVNTALKLEPPDAMKKQLRQLKMEVQAHQDEFRRANGPLAKELAILKNSLGAQLNGS